MWLSTDDKMETMQLIARYNQSIDLGKFDDHAGTFTEDGVFIGIMGRFQGHEELRQHAGAGDPIGSCKPDPSTDGL